MPGTASKALPQATVQIKGKVPQPGTTSAAVKIQAAPAIVPAAGGELVSPVISIIALAAAVIALGVQVWMLL